MNSIIGTVQDGKIIVAAPSDYQDGAKVRVWIDKIGASDNPNPEEDRNQAKLQFLALTELGSFKSSEPYPTRDSLYDRN